MRLLLDMNLSPQLVTAFETGGHTCVHWTGVEDPRASDETILIHAKENGFVLVTHDLDFGAILATSQADSPSVIQVRTQDVLSERFVSTILVALERFAEELNSGALFVIDEKRSRVRILPMAQQPRVGRRFELRNGRQAVLTQATIGSAELAHMLAKTREAESFGLGTLSTGEALAAALVLNRPDWLIAMK